MCYLCIMIFLFAVWIFEIGYILIYIPAMSSSMQPVYISDTIPIRFFLNMTLSGLVTQSIDIDANRLAHLILVW